MARGGGGTSMGYMGPPFSQNVRSNIIRRTLLLKGRPPGTNFNNFSGISLMLQRFPVVVHTKHIRIFVIVDS